MSQTVAGAVKVEERGEVGCNAYLSFLWNKQMFRKHGKSSNLTVSSFKVRYDCSLAKANAQYVSLNVYIKSNQAQREDEVTVSV